jgi:hypothetical protein
LPKIEKILRFIGFDPKRTVDGDISEGNAYGTHYILVVGMKYSWVLGIILYLASLWVVKTASWSIEAIKFSPFFYVLINLTAKYMPRSKFVGLNPISI